jgi:predicted CopG family antitoxin
MSLQTQKEKTTLKMIAVSEENYLALKKLGTAGDSFNDVVTEVLKKVKSLEVVSKG